MSSGIHFTLQPHMTRHAHGRMGLATPKHVQWPVALRAPALVHACRPDCTLQTPHGCSRGSSAQVERPSQWPDVGLPPPGDVHGRRAVIWAPRWSDNASRIKKIRSRMKG